MDPYTKQTSRLCATLYDSAIKDVKNNKIIDATLNFVNLQHIYNTLQQSTLFAGTRLLDLIRIQLEILRSGLNYISNFLTNYDHGSSKVENAKSLFDRILNIDYKRHEIDTPLNSNTENSSNVPAEDPMAAITNSEKVVNDDYIQDVTNKFDNPQPSIDPRINPNLKLKIVDDRLHITMTEDELKTHINNIINSDSLDPTAFKKDCLIAIHAYDQNTFTDMAVLDKIIYANEVMHHCDYDEHIPVLMTKLKEYLKDETTIEDVIEDVNNIPLDSATEKQFENKTASLNNITALELKGSYMIDVGLVKICAEMLSNTLNPSDKSLTP